MESGNSRGNLVNYQYVVRLPVITDRLSRLVTLRSRLKAHLLLTMTEPEILHGFPDLFGSPGLSGSFAVSCLWGNSN